MSKISIINKSINANKLRQPHTSLFFNSCRRTIVCNNQCTTRYFDRTKHPDDHLNRFQSRSILTEADSGAKSDAFREKLGSKDPKFGHITEEEKENWPKFKDFSMANFKKTQKMNTGIIEYLEKQSDKTRTSFDRLFEKITGKRIDNAGNWVVTITLIIGGVMVVAYYKEANDKLRLQFDDILSYRDTLEMEVAQLEQECDKMKEKLIQQGVKL